MSERTPEECVRLSVSALGGLKAVGSQLRPELDPALADEWLAHCLSPSHRQKPSLAQIVLIFARARDAGAHGGFAAFARLCGYEARPIVAQDELAELQRRAIAAARESQAANAELFARMQAAGLKVEA